MKILNFLSTLFGNKDFISKESPNLADFKNKHSKKLDFSIKQSKEIKETAKIAFLHLKTHLFDTRRGRTC